MFVFYILISALLLYICYTDAKSYRIPNWVNALLLVLYPVMLFCTYPWQGEFVWWHPFAILAGGFALSLLLLALNVMGAGDLKLLMVLAVWAGVKGIIPFVVLTGVYGGGLVLMLLVIRQLALFYYPVEKVETMPQQLRMKEPVPYGIGIAAGFLTLLWGGDAALLPLTWKDALALLGV